MAIGDRIKERREQLGITQQQLAERLGYKSKSTINKIEMGINGISQKKIVDFAKALQTTIEYLMEMDSNSVEEIEHPEYYTNPETAAIAQQIYDDHNLHALFDAARGSDPAALKAAAAMLKTFKETNPDG
jgi:transcriptional regulator with XRE-family HTH domain